MTYSITSITLALLFLLASGFSSLGWVVFGMTLAIRLLTTFLIAGRYLRDDTLPRFFWLLPINDGLGLLIWALSWLGSNIRWRGTTLRLRRGGKMVSAWRPLATLSSFALRQGVH